MNRYINNLDILNLINENEDLKKEIEKQCLLKKKEEILKEHPYSIWQSNKDGKWYTYVKSSNKKRKMLKRITYERLLDALLSFYDNPVKDIDFKEA